MKKSFRTISLTLVLALCFTLITTKKVYASYNITAEPSWIITNSTQTKVKLPTLPVESYVLYTSVESDEPSQSQMWRIPPNYPNVQDFNIDGTWYLHVYVPSTGQRETFGPYKKEVAPPPVPQIQALTPGIEQNKWADLTWASFKFNAKGDNGSSGHDNINNCDSYFESGYQYMEIWDNDKLVSDSITDQEAGHTITELGWHKIWVKAVDFVGNVSEWGIFEFGLGPESEIPPDPDNPNPDNPDIDDPGEEIPSGKLGKIKFDPNETIWSNKGKDDEGEGKYPVKVWYTGDNPYKTNGVATIEKEVETTDEDGNKTTKIVTTHKNIPVYFPLERIEVTEDADETVDGDSGTINIEKEGYQLHLHGEGFWGDAEYDEPEGCVSVDYKEPPNPVGDSKEYNIDWTKPEIDFNIKEKIFSEKNGAIRKESILGKDDSFYGKLTVTDNLSGTKFIEYKWTYGAEKPNDGYTRIYESENTNTDKSDEVLENLIEKPVGDNLYLHVRAGDIAGDNEGNKENDTYECFGPYEDPIKLRDFQVTDIRDPRWQDVFWNDTKYKDYKNITFKTKDLPVDEDSHPTLANALPKKGYAFYFDITSEYLYRERDRIEIKPTFYYLKGDQRIRADAYYNNKNNPLVQFGTTNDDSELYMDTAKYGDVLIGGFNKLTLTKGVRIVKGREWIDGWKDEIQYVDGKIQWWYGKYYIPASTFFVKAGELPMPYNKLIGGDILVNFEIIGYKNGVETFSTSQIYNYNNNRWNVEGGPKSSKYSIGDTIMYNGKYGLYSDKDIAVIH